MVIVSKRCILSSPYNIFLALVYFSQKDPSIKDGYRLGNAGQSKQYMDRQDWPERYSGRRRCIYYKKAGLVCKAPEYHK